jgi:hypothetical protein
MYVSCEEKMQCTVRIAGWKYLKGIERKAEAERHGKELQGAKLRLKEVVGNMKIVANRSRWRSFIQVL